ncbi:uncharacterized protein LOC114129319 [Aphis gossypii]|uniref:uncharacterized protein LOC114129319 n=1 Tax=Aphis gossypii TaxID=80765 RepID=UPI002158F505|nr:uncharacterized protein LOC114129319 [Aphis gossypii]XP_050061050.1 uncharacterized protein LOC114129319 [Aphis gossypii]
MTEENLFIMLLYFLTCVILVLWCFRQACYSKNDPLISHSDLNQIQMENVRNLTSVNRVHQRCPVPLNVLNDLEYENFYNPLHTRAHRLHNVEQTSIINMPTPQSTVLNSLNYLVEYNASNATSFSRSPLDDPPPSYDECIASSRLTPRSIH